MNTPSHSLSIESRLEEIAAHFRIFGEPLRLRLLFQLKEGEVSVTELSLRLATTQPNVSKHLKVLLAAGIVRRRQFKNSAFYSISNPSVFALCHEVQQAWSQKAP